MCCLAGVAGLVAVSVASAAPRADGGLLDEQPAAALSVPTDHALDREIIVNNWVLCVSQGFAEELVQAREVSAQAAAETYEELKAEKSCGLFPELLVILREPLYIGSIDQNRDARVFEALVNLAGNWASAFVVSGSLAD